MNQTNPDAGILKPPPESIRPHRLVPNKNGFIQLIDESAKEEPAIKEEKSPVLPLKNSESAAPQEVVVRGAANETLPEIVLSSPI